jgi:hypothetical protein
MNISAATLLTSQSALSPSAKNSTQPTEFSPLLFKKAEAAPAQVAAATPSAPAQTTAAAAPSASAQTAPVAASATPKTYQRPGSTIDIKV